MQTEEENLSSTSTVFTASEKTQKQESLQKSHFVTFLVLPIFIVFEDYSKKSHLKLRAKRATFTLENAKNGQFGKENLKLAVK